MVPHRGVDRGADAADLLAEAEALAAAPHPTAAEVAPSGRGSRRCCARSPRPLGRRTTPRSRPPGRDLAGADLRGEDLRGADLRGAVLIGADLRGGDLADADLLGADLRGADLGGRRPVAGAVRDSPPARLGQKFPDQEGTPPRLRT